MVYAAEMVLRRVTHLTSVVVLQKVTAAQISRKHNTRSFEIHLSHMFIT
jgi:hypothetical protein